MRHGAADKAAWPELHGGLRAQLGYSRFVLRARCASRRLQAPVYVEGTCTQVIAENSSEFLGVSALLQL